MSQRIPDKKIIVVLPAYHAARTLKRTIEAIPKDWVDDIVLVDDASGDDTVAVSRNLGIKTFVHPKNRGYGGNQKTCYREALNLGADIAVMVHPDFQYDPKFIPKMIEPIALGNCDAVFGSRMMIPKNALAGGMPYWKFVANIFLTKIENFILHMNLTEYHSGFRAYSKNALELPLHLNSDNFVFDTEIIVQMKAAGMTIKEIPISTRYFPEASMIGIRRSIIYGLSILKVMTRYILWKLGIIQSSQLTESARKKIICPVCDEKNHVRLYRYGTASIRDAIKESYCVSNEKSGRFDNLVICSQCDSVFAEHYNSLTDKDLGMYYKEAPHDSVYVSTESGRGKTALRILHAIKKFSEDKNVILDVGCNTGIFLTEANKLGFEVYGIEPSIEAARIAKGRLGSQKITEGGFESMTHFNDGFFNVITAFDVLEHLKDPNAFIKLASNKLKVRGILVIAAPNIKSVTARIMGSRWYALVPSHLFYFSLRSLKKLGEKHGLSIVYSRSYVRYFQLSYIFSRILRKDIALPRFLDFMIPVVLFDEPEIYFRKN